MGLVAWGADPLSARRTAAPIGGPPLDEFRLRWAWSVSGDRIGTTSFEVTDLDSDGRIEILTTAGVDLDYPYPNDGRWYIVEFDGDSAVQTWSSFTYEDPLRVVRLVRDSEPPQIVAATGSSAFVYDAGTRELLRQFALQSTSTRSVAVGDLDDDGTDELVACDEGGLYVHDFLTGVALAANFAFDCLALDLGQLDGDPASEIAVTGGTFGTLVIDGESLSVQWADTLSTGRLALISNANTDGNDELLYFPEEGGALRAVDIDTDETVWDGPGEYPLDLARGDLDDDGDFEILLTQYGGTVRVVDELDGSVRASFESTGTGTGAASALADVDLDGDADLVTIVRVDTFQIESIVAFDFSTRALIAQMVGTKGPIVDITSGHVIGPPDSSLVTVTAGDWPYSSDIAQLLRFDLPAFTSGYSAPLSYRSSSTTSVVAAQLDGDAALELCLAFGDDGVGTVYCEDGETHVEEWHAHLGEFPFSIQAADLDGDGQRELLVGSSLPAIYALEGATGWLRWRTPILWELNTLYSVIRVGNVDQDAALEVVGGGPTAGPYTESIVVFDAVTGALEWGPHASQTIAFDLAQLDLDPPDEILIGSAGGELQILDPVTGSVSLPLADYDDPIRSVRLGDVDRDGVLDIASLVSGRLVVRGGAQASDLFLSTYLHEQAGFGDDLSITDLDGNGVPELVVGTYLGFAVYDAPLIGLFSDGFESGDTSAWSEVLP